jgi:hypothetical protein
MAAAVSEREIKRHRDEKERKQRRQKARIDPGKGERAQSGSQKGRCGGNGEAPRLNQALAGEGEHCPGRTKRALELVGADRRYGGHAGGQQSGNGDEAASTRHRIDRARDKGNRHQRGNQLGGHVHAAPIATGGRG